MTRRPKKTGKGKRRNTQKMKQLPMTKTHSSETPPSISGSHTLNFDAQDTLFFRESRPMESIGGSELSSIFPPPARTLIGSVRSLIGERENVNWGEYAKQKEQHPLSTLIGYADDLGPLTFKGPWLHKKGERLYPAPLNLMQNETEIKFLNISAPRHCDLGKAVRLPCLPQGFSHAKPLEDHWLTRAAFEQVLLGNTPPPGKIFAKKSLVSDEPRLGIALDNQRRTAQEHMLYQTRHIRLHETHLALDISGQETPLTAQSITRLGGEGRMASITPETTPILPKKPQSTRATHGIILYLLTPARFSQSTAKNWSPLPSFTQEEETNTVWKGHINGISLTLHSAITGKAQREGGWDMIKHQPRAVQSLIPAGSCWYLTVDDNNINAAIAALHGTHIGHDHSLGRGQILIGLWLK